MEVNSFSKWLVLMRPYVAGFNRPMTNQHRFLSLKDAVEKVERWRVDYNLVRPHSAIGNLSPAQFARVHQNPGRVA